MENTEETEDTQRTTGINMALSVFCSVFHVFKKPFVSNIPERVVIRINLKPNETRCKNETQRTFADLYVKNV